MHRAMIDEATRESFFEVRNEVDPAILDRLAADIEMTPGMPAEVFILTGEQSFSYIAAPVTLSFRKEERRRSASPKGTPAKCCPQEQLCSRDNIQTRASSSARTMRAPSAIAFIFPKAESRGRYFSPQSGATTMFAAST